MGIPEYIYPMALWIPYGKLVNHASLAMESLNLQQVNQLHNPHMGFFHCQVSLQYQRANGLAQSSNVVERNPWGILSFWTFRGRAIYQKQRFLRQAEPSTVAIFFFFAPSMIRAEYPKQIPTKVFHFTHLLPSGQTWLAGKSAIQFHVFFPFKCTFCSGISPGAHHV